MNRTLVVLAAGMGSRYGGLKQIDPITEKGEFIVDFSIYAAIEIIILENIIIVDISTIPEILSILRIFSLLRNDIDKYASYN